MSWSAWIVVLATVVVASGCASTGEASAGASSAPPAGEYKPLGEISYRAGSASFDETRVVGPHANLSRRADGSWAGTLMGGTVDVSVYPHRVVGVNLTLAIERKPEGIVITGQYQGRILRFEVGPEQLLIRTPSMSATLPKVGEGQYGQGGAVRLTGQAADPNPPWPQFGLALAAAFMG